MATVCARGREPLEDSYCPIHDSHREVVPDADAEVPPPAETEAPPEPEESAVESGCWSCAKEIDERNDSCLSCGATLPAPRLVVEWSASGRRIGLREGEMCRLGRETGPYADIFEARDNVSRLHAMIGVEEDGRAWIRDLGSMNGTFVNGLNRESERLWLEDGDTIAFGQDPAVEARVTLRKAPHPGSQTS